MLWSPPFLVRYFLYQPFNIPSGSMIPTLVVGDYVFAAKYAYGYSRYSFPDWLPQFSGRVFATEPARGDVVVFRSPKESTVDYVKRVVGMPGDRVQMQDGQLVINDKPVRRGAPRGFAGDRRVPRRYRNEGETLARDTAERCQLRDL